MNLIPGGASTASKSPTRYVDAVPKYTERGNGAYLWATDGQRFLDFGMGLGACVLGYAHPEVNAAAKRAIDQGTLFTLPSYREEQTAAALLRHVPWAGQLRWAKNGTDVTTAAVRLSRHATGRSWVLTHGYHGWGAWSLAEPAYGCTRAERLATVELEFLEDEDAVYQHDYAAVIVEVAPDAVPGDPHGWYRGLREACDATGALLIFDEILSGFRYRMGSATDVVPDLACFGKSIANGFPLSCLVGKRDLMQHLEPGGVFFSGTSFGETASLAACEATLKLMEREHVPEFITGRGRELRSEFNALAAYTNFPGCCDGDGARTVITGLTHEQRDLFQQECATRGLLYNGSHIISLAHTSEVITSALDIYAKAMQAMEGAVLVGEPTVEPYRIS